MLRRVILGVLALGGALSSGSVFASCGEPGRNCESEDPVMRRVEVVGFVNDFDVEETCASANCDFVWYVPDGGGESGGGGDDGGSVSEALPIGIPPPPPEMEDLDTLCVTWNVSDIPYNLGGGFARLDICFGDSSYEINQCQDFPEWGSSACPYLTP